MPAGRTPPRAGGTAIGGPSGTLPATSLARIYGDTVTTPDRTEISAAPYLAGRTRVRRTLGVIAAGPALLSGAGALLWSSPLLAFLAGVGAGAGALMLVLAHTRDATGRANAAAPTQHDAGPLRPDPPRSPAQLSETTLERPEREPLVVSAAMSSGRAALFFGGAEYRPPRRAGGAKR